MEEDLIVNRPAPGAEKDLHVNLRDDDRAEALRKNGLRPLSSQAKVKWSLIIYKPLHRILLTMPPMVST